MSVFTTAKETIQTLLHAFPIAVKTNKMSKTAFFRRPWKFAIAVTSIIDFSAKWSNAFIKNTMIKCYELNLN